MTYLLLGGKETNFQIVQSEKKKKKIEKFIASHLDVIVDDCIVFVHRCTLFSLFKYWSIGILMVASSLVL